MEKWVSSSVVEQKAVNFQVVGSLPTSPSILKNMGEVHVQDNDYFCNLCKPHWRFLGEFNDSYFLAQDQEKNQFLIGKSSGHAEVVFYFPQGFMPTPDPLGHDFDDFPNNDPRFARSDIWLDKVKEFEKSFIFDPRTGYEIFSIFEKSGWTQDKHGDLLYYIVHIAGTLIQEYESGIA